MSRKMIDYNINEEGYIDKIDGKQLKGTGGDRAGYVDVEFTIEGRTWKANTPETISAVISYPEDVSGPTVKYITPVDYCIYKQIDGIPFMLFVQNVSLGTSTAFSAQIIALPLASGTTTNDWWNTSFRLIISA